MDPPNKSLILSPASHTKLIWMILEGAPEYFSVEKIRTSFIRQWLSHLLI